MIIASHPWDVADGRARTYLRPDRSQAAAPSRPKEPVLAASALAVVALLAAPLQDAAPLLPEAPEGWSSERLTFPLSFAPELEYEGVEELRFAPGMFDPASPSWFSYAMAIRLEEELDVDEAWLEGFFGPYYLGLSRAVSSGRAPAPDPATFATDAERSREGFVVTARIVEPFVTGKPLTLRVEVSVHPRPGATEVLGLASPLPDDAGVWAELRALRDAWRAARPVPLFLNHLYLVPDAGTYRAFEEAGFLRERFAVSEERATVRRDTSYSGLYFYGRSTYFELLPAGAAGLSEGSTGLAFGIELEGGTERLAAALEQREVTTFGTAVTRGVGEEQVQIPWFRLLGVQQPHERSRLSLFTMEYDPGFTGAFEGLHSPPAPGFSRTDREGVLESYASALGLTELRAEAPFGDVVEVQLALDEAQRDRLREVCETGGFRAEEGPRALILAGPRIRLVVRTSQEPGGIRAFRVGLRGPVQREPMVLGRARVTFEGDTALFTFGD